MTDQTSPETATLKPCPFCGIAAEYVCEGDHHGDYFRLGCPDEECAAHWAFYTEPQENAPECIARWNRRFDAGQLEIESLKGAMRVLEEGYDRIKAERDDLAQCSKVPDGYVLVPRELTAENGAKSALIGEFSETFDYMDDEGDECQAEIPVSWTTIKAIHKKVVALFASADTSTDSPKKIAQDIVAQALNEALSVTSPDRGGKA